MYTSTKTLSEMLVREDKSEGLITGTLECRVPVAFSETLMRSGSSWVAGVSESESITITSGS